MKPVDILSLINYGLVLIYGLFLSCDISGGWENNRQKHIIFALCPVFLLVQSVCWITFGVSAVKQIYPFIVHIPLALTLIFALKKPVGVSIVSTCTAYLCCQLPRWGDIAVTAATGSELAGEISYTILIMPAFFLLRRYFARAAHDAMTYSPSALLLFGSLPAAYYIFDYATTIYSDALYLGIQAINEFLPTAIIIFYVMFLTAYHVLMSRSVQAEMQSSMLESQLRQSQFEIDSMRRSERQTAVYQHDMRHHLNMIGSLLDVGQPEKAREYIGRVRSDIESITPKRFCENATVNLLCSSFAEKAARTGVSLTIDAKLPPSLSISDTEICTLLSNGLENALNAASKMDEGCRWVNLSCSFKLNKLLIEIRNPYMGDIKLNDGLPAASSEGHGYGCRSIRTIVQNHGGLCEFSPEDGVFLLRLMLPVKSE